MATTIVVDPRAPDPAVVADAVRTLRAGELVVLPTETVYGLAADPRAPGAVEKIFRAKQRPSEKEIALLLADDQWASVPVIHGHAVARRLGERFWPGPLTLVVPDGETWTGYRVPDHPVTQAVLREMSRGLAVTSANLSGHPPAHTADEAARDLGNRVALILDAGSTGEGPASTVVKLWHDRIKILRTGALTESDIRGELGA